MAPLQDQPGGRDPAPEPLELVQAFVNTNDMEGRRDKAGTPALLRSWLARHGLVDVREPISEAAFVRALQVREALRALALANNGAALDPGAVETINHTGARTRLKIEFGADGGARLKPEGAGVEAALGTLLAAVLEAMQRGTWTQMKACRRDTCRWVFYDHSRNGSSSWCSMAVCGNRAKTRAYRRRRRAAHGT
jgi:predicted RNA-binding Zn ribbon-like protein